MIAQLTQPKEQPVSYLDKRQDVLNALSDIAGVTHMILAGKHYEKCMLFEVDNFHDLMKHFNVTKLRRNPQIYFNAQLDCRLDRYDLRFSMMTPTEKEFIKQYRNRYDLQMVSPKPGNRR